LFGILKGGCGQGSNILGIPGKVTQGAGMQVMHVGWHLAAGGGKWHLQQFIAFIH